MPVHTTMRASGPGSDSDPALEIHRLGRRYGRNWALRECSFTLPRGRMAALVGPNGAGKSTLLHLAIGLLEPSEGTVRVFGHEPSAQSLAVLQRVGFVAQDHPLYRGFTVADTLAFGRHMNREWDGSLAEARLRRLGIPLDQRVGKLSGGQQAQVALAIALAKRPELLLLDEPVASLDPLARREFLRTLVEAASERGITTLLSSHIIADLEQACEYLIILSASHVQLTGDISAIQQSHRLLVGPYGDAVGLAAVRDAWVTLEERPTSQHTTLIVRSGAIGATAEHAPLPPAPAGWSSEPISLEDIVLAYLSQPVARGVAPAPLRPAYERQMEVSQ